MGKRDREKQGGNQSERIEKNHLGTLGDLIEGNRKLLDKLPDAPQSIHVTFRGKDYAISLKKNDPQKTLKLLKYFLRSIKEGFDNVSDVFLTMLTTVESCYSDPDNEKEIEIRIKIAEIKKALNLESQEAAARPQEASQLSVDQATFDAWVTRFEKTWRGRVLFDQWEALERVIAQNAENETTQKNYPGADLSTLRALWERVKDRKPATAKNSIITAATANHVPAVPAPAATPQPVASTSVAPAKGKKPDPEPDDHKKDTEKTSRITPEEIKKEAEAIIDEVAIIETKKGKEAAEAYYQRIIKRIRIFIRFKRNPEETTLFEDNQGVFDEYYSNYEAEDFISLLKELGEWKERENKETLEITPERIAQDAERIKKYKDDPKKGLKYYLSVLRNLRAFITHFDRKAELTPAQEETMKFNYRGYDKEKLIALLEALKEPVEAPVARREARSENKKERPTLEMIKVRAAETIEFKKTKGEPYYRGVINNINELSKLEEETLNDRGIRFIERIYPGWKVPEDFIELIKQIDVLEDAEEVEEGVENEEGPDIEQMAQEIFKLKSSNPERYEDVLVNVKMLADSEEDNPPEELKNFVEQFFKGWQIPEDFQDLVEELEKLDEFFPEETERTEKELKDEKENKQELAKANLQKELDETYTKVKQNIMTVDDIEEMKRRLNRLIDESGLEEDDKKTEFREKVEKMVKVSNWKRGKFGKYGNFMALNAEEFNEFLRKINRSFDTEDKNMLKILGFSDVEDFISFLREEKWKFESIQAKPKLQIKPYAHFETLVEGDHANVLAQVQEALQIEATDHPGIKILQSKVRRIFDQIQAIQEDKVKKQNLKLALIDEDDNVRSPVEGLLGYVENYKRDL